MTKKALNLGFLLTYIPRANYKRGFPLEVSISFTNDTTWKLLAPIRLLLHHYKVFSSSFMGFYIEPNRNVKPVKKLKIHLNSIN